MSTNESNDNSLGRNYTISEDINGPVLAAAFAVETVLAFIPNFFIVVYTLYHYKVLKQPSMIFLTALAGSNLLVTVLFMPFSVITAAAGEWIFGRTDEQRDAMCQFVGFIFAFGVTLIVHTLALISLDRFLLIVKPLFYKKYMTTVSGVVLLIVMSIYSIVLDLPLFFGFGRFDLSISTASCIPIWVGETYFVIYLSVLSFIPSSTIIITSLWTFFFTRKFIKQQRRQQQHASVLSLANTTNDTEGDNIYTRRVQKLFGLFGSLLLILIITSSTYLICSVAGLFVGFDEIPPQVYATAFIMFLAGNIASAIVQSCFRRDLKEAVLYRLNGIWRCFTGCCMCANRKEDQARAISSGMSGSTSVQASVFAN